LRRPQGSPQGYIATTGTVVRATLRNVVEHWALAIFSLVAASGIWFVIQDVENPRIEALVPIEGTQGVLVTPVNLSPEFVLAQTSRVRVRVEARENDIPTLRASDFRATVDLQGIAEGDRASLPVEVESLNSNVTVLSVDPPRIQVELVRIQSEEFPVQVNITGSLPASFRESQDRVISPAFVTASARPELLANVDRIEIDVNLSGQRESFRFTGPLVARNRNGDTQIVTLSNAQATVEFFIEQVTIEKTLPLRHRLSGNPAPGYQVDSITIQPRFVTVTGAREIVDSLTEVVLESVDINGASDSVTQRVPIQIPPNVAVLDQRVDALVEVGISPIECGIDTDGGCGAATLYVAPRFQDVPQGLQVAPGSYVAIVKVAGPIGAAGTVNPDTIEVVVSLSDASEGVSTFMPTATVPPPHEVESVEPIEVRLIPAAAP
jgi:YbbR domain-containing protein